MSILTLLTDFGLQDSYVGVMKGVIYGIAPTVQIVDLTHAIAPQDIWGGRFHLATAVDYFPRSSVHVGVVDPGVGTARRAIAFRTEQGYFVGPDNGLLVLDCPIQEAVVLDQPKVWRSPSASATFHGRDIFAAVGAHLTLSKSLHQVGTAIDPQTLVRLPAVPAASASHLIQAIDHFGNCITTINGKELPSGWRVQVKSQVVTEVRTYGEAPNGTLVALVGSHGFVELAIVGGDARSVLNLQVGSPVQCVAFDGRMEH